MTPMALRSLQKLMELKIKCEKYESCVVVKFEKMKKRENKKIVGKTIGNDK